MPAPNFTELGSTGLKRSGGTIADQATSTFPSRVVAKMGATQVLRTDECWEWVGAVNKCGYGIVNTRTPRTALAHRAAFELLTGVPIPEGKELDHLCRVRRCVNPAHLDLVTHEENMRRSIAGYRKENAVCKVCGADDWGVTRAKKRINPSRHCRNCQRQYMSKRRKASQNA